jgi:hypothetical protein
LETQACQVLKVFRDILEIKAHKVFRVRWDLLVFRDHRESVESKGQRAILDLKDQLVIKVFRGHRV